MHIGLSLNEIIKIICYFILILFLSFSQNNIKLNIKRVHKPKDIFLHHKVYIEAHRGANKEFFQNTMEAFKKSIQYEADAIETDVWLTKDNELVLLHANSIYGSLTNYYDHEGNVIDLTWAELSTYRTIKDNLTMPRLRDLMEIAKNKIFIDLEIKDQRIDLVFPEIIKLIEEFNFFDQISICSPFYGYYDKILEYNKHHHHNLVFGFLYNKDDIYLFDYSKKGSSLNIYWADATKNVCREARRNGMAILAWIDIDDIENIGIYKQLIENGVDVICCNRPDLAKNYLKDYYNQ